MTQVPQLFLIFSRLFGVQLPGRWKKVQVKSVGGVRRYEEKWVLYSPGATHCKEMAGVMNQLNKLQVSLHSSAHISFNHHRSLHPSSRVDSA